MIPYSYEMVDMGGIDLAEANGTFVDGLYDKIVEAVNACGDVVLYNWKFAGIEIAPQHTSILLGNPITINGAVQVTEQDLVTVPGINPGLVSIDITENGSYYPSDYHAGGFDEVNVSVHPVLVSIDITENGDYDPEDYEAEGFSSVSVSVDEIGSEAVAVETKSTGMNDASLWVTYNSDQPVAVFYGDVSAGAYQDFGFVRIMYNVSAAQSPDGHAHSGWCVFALSTCISKGVEYSQNQLIKTWNYNTTTFSVAYKMRGE